MDLKQIKQILDLIAKSEVDEVSIEEGDFKIKVKKTGTVEQVTYTQPMMQQAPQAVAPVATPSPTTEVKAEPVKTAASGETVKSPIVGTYYKAASPDSEDFVNVGDKVAKGQTLCIIEAMKIMNEIEAEFAGKVVELLVSDGTPVEFDQPLFIIQKD